MWGEGGRFGGDEAARSSGSQAWPSRQHLHGVDVLGRVLGAQQRLLGLRDVKCHLHRAPRRLRVVDKDLKMGRGKGEAGDGSREPEKEAEEGRASCSPRGTGH